MEKLSNFMLPNLDQPIRQSHSGPLISSGSSQIPPVPLIIKLFKSANKQYENLNGVKYFGNINKWSPADIYFATEKAKKQYKKLASDRETKNNNLTFAVLNKTIADSIESGDLLPLSLKKVNKKVYVQRVNFSRDKEEELPERMLGAVRFNHVDFAAAETLHSRLTHGACNYI